MRNKLNCNLVGKLQLKPLHCLGTLIQKVLDDCTFSTFEARSYRDEKVLKK